MPAREGSHRAVKRRETNTEREKSDNRSDGTSSNRLEAEIANPYHSLSDIFQKENTCTKERHNSRIKHNCAENPCCLLGLGEHKREGIWAANPVILDNLRQKSPISIREGWRDQRSVAHNCSSSLSSVCSLVTASPPPSPPPASTAEGS